MFTIITSGYKEASVVICYTGKLGKKRDSYEYLEAGQVGGDQKEDAKTSLPTLSPEETPDFQKGQGIFCGNFKIYLHDNVSIASHLI